MSRQFSFVILWPEIAKEKVLGRDIEQNKWPTHAWRKIGSFVVPGKTLYGKPILHSQISSRGVLGLGDVGEFGDLASSHISGIVPYFSRNVDTTDNRVTVAEITGEFQIYGEI